jgi:hypothetical protein
LSDREGGGVDVVFLVVDDLAPGQTRKQFDNEVLELLLRMLGITHTRNTKVGSALRAKRSV